MSDAVARKKNRFKLLLVAAVCIAPVIASYTAYYFLQPGGHTNYGELITPPQPLPDPALTTVAGQPFKLSELRNKWVLLVAQPGACDAYCEQQLVYIRQIRLAQGKDAERIERVWLVSDAATPRGELLAQFPELHVVRAAGTPLLAALPATQSVVDHIYIVDMLGNVMMRYPRDADPRKMLKDIGRLLRHSKWTPEVAPK